MDTENKSLRQTMLAERWRIIRNLRRYDTLLKAALAVLEHGGPRQPAIAHVKAVHNSMRKMLSELDKLNAKKLY